MRTHCRRPQPGGEKQMKYSTVVSLNVAVTHNGYEPTEEEIITTFQARLDKPWKKKRYFEITNDVQLLKGKFATDGEAAANEYAATLNREQ